MAEKILLTVPEASTMLGLGRSKVYELIRTGDLRPVRIGRAVRLPVQEVEAFVERLREESEAAR